MRVQLILILISINLIENAELRGFFASNEKVCAGNTFFISKQTDEVWNEYDRRNTLL